MRSADVTISVHLDTPPPLPLHFPQYECAFDYIKDGVQGEISLQNYMRKKKTFFAKIILEFFLSKNLSYLFIFSAVSKLDWLS